MLNLLIVPHSYAATKRNFNIVRKYMPAVRPNLSTEALCTFLVVVNVQR